MRVILPHHLSTLAKTGRTLELDAAGQSTINAILDILEGNYPMLHGTIRDRLTRQRRPFIRYFACGQDLSLEDADTPLPEAVLNGSEPLRIVGAMAGG